MHSASTGDINVLLLQFPGWILDCEAIGLSSNSPSESHSIGVFPPETHLLIRQAFILEPVSCTQDKTLKAMEEPWCFCSDRVVAVLGEGRQSGNGVSREKKKASPGLIIKSVSTTHTQQHLSKYWEVTPDCNDNVISKGWLGKDA